MAPTTEQWRWRVGNDTGESSLAIWHAMTGEPGLGSYTESTPYDSDDFGRCIRLLREFGWEDRMADMADVSSSWQSMAAHWDAMAAMWDKKAYSALNKRLSEIHDELARTPTEDWLDSDEPISDDVDPEDVDPAAFADEQDYDMERHELNWLIYICRKHPDLCEQLWAVLAENTPIEEG